MPKKDEEEQQVSYEDERRPKSEAVQFLGIVPKDNNELMARTRLSKRAIGTFSMLETQEEALNPKRENRLLSTTWRKITARNLFAQDGMWRTEMQAILEVQSEERAAEMAFKE